MFEYYLLHTDRIYPVYEVLVIKCYDLDRWYIVAEIRKKRRQEMSIKDVSSISLLLIN